MLNENAALIVSTPIQSKEIAKLNSYLGEMGLIRPDLIPLDDEGDKLFLRLGVYVILKKRQQGWCWVDYVAASKKRYGEEFYGLIDLLGEYESYYIRDLVNLHYDFPLHQRKWKLTPAHYRLVRTLPEKYRVELLEQAEAKRWGSSITLRAEVRKIRDTLESNGNAPNSSDNENDHPDTPS